jgi:arsenate reductase (thioredoxin)
MMNFTPLTVLFLSTGNSARSLLAEAILRQKGGDRFNARSAGFKPLRDVHSQTIALLAAQGVPAEHLHTKGWSEFVAAAHVLKIDVIVTLSEEAQKNCPAWPGDPVRVHWPVDDPLAAERSEVMEWKFRKCFATLENRIATLIKTRISPNPSELLLQLKGIGMVV